MRGPPKVEGVTSGAVNATSLTLATPSRLDGSPLQRNDHLVVGFIGGNNTVTPPSGWLKLVESLFTPATGVNIASQIFARRVDTIEPSSHVFTFGSTIKAAIMFGVSNVDALDPYDGEPFNATSLGGDDSVIPVPAINPTRRDFLKIALGGLRGGNVANATTITPPAGYVEIGERNTGALTASNKVVMAMAYKIMPDPDTLDGAASMTGSNLGDTRTGMSVGLAPPPPAKYVGRIGT